MAVGYYDSNGVWHFGESDLIGVVTDTLNIGQTSVSTQFTADRSRLSALEVTAGIQYVAASAAARDSHFGVPANATQQLALQNSGAQTIRTDKGWTERYFGVYNSSTNPGGVTVAGWYPVAGELPYCKVSGGTTIGTTTTAFSWATDDVDRTDMHSTSTNPTRITAAIAGLYHVHANLRTAASTGAMFYGYVNGTQITNVYGGIVGGTGANASPIVAGYVTLAAGDYFEIKGLAAASTVYTSSSTLVVRYMQPE